MNAQAKDAARALNDALSATVNMIGDEVGQWFGHGETTSATVANDAPGPIDTRGDADPTRWQRGSTSRWKMPKGASREVCWMRRTPTTIRRPDCRLHKVGATRPGLGHPIDVRCALRRPARAHHGHAGLHGRSARPLLTRIECGSEATSDEQVAPERSSDLRRRVDGRAVGDRCEQDSSVLPISRFGLFDDVPLPSRACLGGGWREVARVDGRLPHKVERRVELTCTVTLLLHLLPRHSHRREMLREHSGQVLRTDGGGNDLR